MVDKGLYKTRKKFRIGSGEGKDVSGREYGGGSSKSSSGGNNNTGGGGDNNNTGGGGGRDNIPITPVQTTLPSNIPAIDTTQPYNPAGTIASTVPMDIREQYRVGNNISMVPGLGPVTVMDQPFSSQALETQRYSNYLDSRNLANMEYPGVTGNVPSFIPYSGAINTGINLLSGIIGKPGFEKNSKFFADNVAGKYGYGYGYDDYKEYMQDRMAGKVNAYGRTLTDAERGGNDNNIGIASIQPIVPLTADQEPEEETPMTDYERYQSYLQNFFGGI